jgi:glycine/D-amino acid oxidase-like deaminating enzyme
MAELYSDVTVIGAGIAGLWCAKELLERGATVSVVESADQISQGATERNEGWLHAGTYHATAISEEAEAAKVCEQIINGHRAVVEFAPECVEQTHSVALVKSEDYAEKALVRWQNIGIEHVQISLSDLDEYGINTDGPVAAFTVADKSIDTQLLCSKLADYITYIGAKILIGEEARPIDDGVVSVNGNILKSDQILITAGASTTAVVSELCGVQPSERYFKSHILVVPKLADVNCFYIDPLEAGVMDHAKMSTVAVNRDNVEIEAPNYGVIDTRRQIIENALYRLSNRARDLALRGCLLRACIKPDINMHGTYDPNKKQNLDMNIFEPQPGFMCALPGKMTQAPALAQAVADRLTW